MTHPRSNLHRLALCTALTVGASHAAVYRCTDGDGTPGYSQFPCGNGSRVQLEPLRTVRAPPLSDAARALLDDLERQRLADEKQRARSRARAARRAQAAEKDKHRRCRTARKAQAALLRKRRHGYRVDEARELDRQQSELAAAVRQNC